MGATLNLMPDDLLSTTRAVRKRLDFERPVPVEVVEECVEVATQAPTGSNQQGWHWMIVTDAGQAQDARRDLRTRLRRVSEHAELRRRHQHRRRQS